MKAQTERPTKEQVRYWQQDRNKERKPLPSPEEIRRQLGWHLKNITQ